MTDLFPGAPGTHFFLLLVAAVVLDDFTVDVGPFIAVVAIFAVLQGVLAPFVARTAHRNAPTLVGGAGLITTFVALVITDVLSESWEGSVSHG